VIPKDLEPQVDRNVSFLQLKEAPASYLHRNVVLGGEVLSVKPGSDTTRIEFLQLPLNQSLEPATDRTKSTGRFLAEQPGMVDPATLPPGTRVTVVGEVTGATKLPIGEESYSYPTLLMKHLKTWEAQAPAGRPGVGVGIGGIFGGGRGGGFGGVGVGVGTGGY
jgi:outer membrane lipoprotein